MTVKTLSQTEWTFVSTVLTTPEMQPNLWNTENCSVTLTEQVEESSTVRYVAAFSKSKQPLYLPIADLSPGTLVTLKEHLILSGEL